MNSALGSKSKAYTLEAKHQHVKQWQKSGLTMTQYANQNGISVSSISKWSKESIPSAFFQPILQPEESPLKPKNCLSPEGLIRGLEMVLPNGIVLRIQQPLEASAVMLWIQEMVRCN